jgi:AhpD family alkylhydroperoxidase
MAKQYSEITADISEYIRKLRKEIPEVMTGFSAMAQAATKTHVLDKKTKEFIALAIGVSTRCDGCIGFHAETLAQLGATREEVLETIGMSIYMGGGPSLMYAADALRAFDEFSEKKNQMK